MQKLNGIPALVDLSDNQIQQLARTLFTPFKLTEERFIHLLNELRATQLFQQRCKDPNEEFVCYAGVSTPDLYRESVSFLLRNKSTGIESIPSTSMNALPRSWGY